VVVKVRFSKRKLYKHYSKKSSKPEDNKNSYIFSGHFSLLNPMIKIFLFFFLLKHGSSRCFSTGSFAILSRARLPTGM